MLAALGARADLDDLVAEAMPASIRMTGRWICRPRPAEAQALPTLRRLAARNKPVTAMIGLGYHGTITPSVIRRNVLEDPAWYTAYTPYQPEISQGRLEALLNFQTMVADLTGLPIAGASLLDEATAVAEAMTLARRVDQDRQVLLLDADTLPQTVARGPHPGGGPRDWRSRSPPARWPRPSRAPTRSRSSSRPRGLRPAGRPRRAPGRRRRRTTRRAPRSSPPATCSPARC